MTNKQLCKKIALKLGISSSDAQLALDAVTHEIEQALITGDLVSIRGFGVFFVAKIPARAGRNPRTGGSMLFKARDKVNFRAYGQLKELVN